MFKEEFIWEAPLGASVPEVAADASLFFGSNDKVNDKANDKVDDRVSMFYRELLNPIQVSETGDLDLQKNISAKTVLFLKPKFKERCWGGNKLNTEFGYDTGMEDKIGECWGISAYKTADCEVEGGEYDGYTLSELWEKEPQLFGSTGLVEFPLLTKILDAKKDLSIQVHPDNEFARKEENSLGKKECWYILDCPKDASIIVGNRAKNHEDLVYMIDNGKWTELCNEITVNKGDFIQINPGTLHAIKGDILVLESQQSSDITYRVYDYDREVNGKKRELHIDKGLKVINAPDSFSQDSVIHTNNTPDEKQLLEDNECYKIWKYRITKETDLAHEYAFMNCSVIEGEGIVDGRPVKKGTHFIIPAGMKSVNASGDFVLIMSTV